VRLDGACSLACVASVPEPREQNWGHAKEFFSHSRCTKNEARAKKWKERGREKEGTLARKPLDFEKRPLVFTVEFIY